jgi:electron-transferring-flavoprotein dehydrogenase
MELSGLTGGKLNLSGPDKRPYERIPSLEEYYADRLSAAEVEEVRRQCRTQGTSLHDALMERSGWPPIANDGRLLVSHQDALLLGGKVQAPSGYPDHIVFLYPELCESCGNRLCIEVCSGGALTPGEEDGVPAFDREKCVHCGACVWNCTQPLAEDPERGNVELRAGAGGLHSTEN